MASAVNPVSNGSIISSCECWGSAEETTVLESRVISVARLAFYEQEVLEEKWSLITPLLERLAEMNQFEFFIDLLVDTTQRDPQVRLPVLLIAYLCQKFKITSGSPLKAVYALIKHVPGPTFLKVMHVAGLTLQGPNLLPWEALDATQDTTGVINWLNVYICASLSAPSVHYTTFQKWVDIALLNACRSTESLNFYIRGNPYYKDNFLPHLLENLEMRLAHINLKEENPEQQASNQGCYREILQATPFLFPPYQNPGAHALLDTLVEKGIALGVASEVFACLAELMKMDKLPPPPLRFKKPSCFNYFDVLLQYLKPQPHPLRKKVLTALVDIVGKTFHNQMIDERIRNKPVYKWHIYRMSSPAQTALKNFFRDPFSGKLYRFEDNEYADAFQVFQTLRQRNIWIFSSSEMNEYCKRILEDVSDNFID